MSKQPKALTKALERMHARLAINPLRLLCLKHHALLPAQSYISNRGYKLACGCIRPSALGNPEPRLTEIKNA